MTFVCSDYNSINMKIGQKMTDGSIYAGVSETTNTNMFAAPEDSGIMRWKKAVEFTENITGLCGRKGSKQSTDVKLRKAIEKGTEDGGWRLPTDRELNQLHENKCEIGGFNKQKSSTYAWYLSLSDAGVGYAYGQCFIDGHMGYSPMSTEAFVRCIRTVPRLEKI